MIEFSIHFNGKESILLEPNHHAWVTSDQISTKSANHAGQRKSSVLYIFILLSAFRGNKYIAVKTLSTQSWYFNHSFVKYVLNTYYVPVIVLFSRETILNKTDKGVAVMEFKLCLGDIYDQQLRDWIYKWRTWRPYFKKIEFWPIMCSNLPR